MACCIILLTVSNNSCISLHQYNLKEGQQHNVQTIQTKLRLSGAFCKY